MSNVLPLYRTLTPPAAEVPYPTSCTKTITFGVAVIALDGGGRPVAGRLQVGGLRPGPTGGNRIRYPCVTSR
jgi:hypothetical protein